MPIYAFQCDTCGHQFERLQRLADADPTECPACHVANVRRQLTAPSFRLAGAGWYETDFKKDGDTKRNLADKPDAGPAAASAGESAKTSTSESAPKSDAKPDPKPDPRPVTKPATKTDGAPVKPAAPPASTP